MTRLIYLCCPEGNEHSKFSELIAESDNGVISCELANKIVTFRVR
jgi:hypothetical protein